MKKETVRQQVNEFRQNTAFGKEDADCFAPWYLCQNYHLSEAEAIRQSADSEEYGGPGYDFGMDAYYIDRQPSKPVKIIIVQAKYSDSLNYILKAYKELGKSLCIIDQLLQSLQSIEAIENKIIVNLRADINRLGKSERNNCELEFVVIHLFDDEEVIFGNKTRKVREELKESISEIFPNRKSSIKNISPNQMGPMKINIAPPPLISIRFKGEEVEMTDSSKMHHGIGHLSDLVELYRSRRDALFSKNVRYFLTSKRNTEKGPAGKMKETLKNICIDKMYQPEIFAFYHNGVTLHVSEIISTNEIDGKIEVRDPYVLNGCQTIKNAYIFRNDPRYKNKISIDKWDKIVMPIRIVVSRSDELIRQVTISNNRQNSISWNALRANDPVQIQLEQRFKDEKVKIFYERQEGAYANLEDSEPDVIEEEYANTRGRAVYIVDLARSIEAAAGEIGLARRVGELFESDAGYNRCFSEKRLSSVILLTFLQNLHDALPIVLKKDLKLEREGDGPRPSSLNYYALCLLIRYLAKKKDFDTVIEYGKCLWGKNYEFREKLTQLLDNRHSSIKWALQDKFLNLSDSSADSLNAAFERAQSSLRLGKDIDVFEIFMNLDEIDT